MVAVVALSETVCCAANFSIVFSCSRRSSFVFVLISSSGSLMPKSGVITLLYMTSPMSQPALKAPKTPAIFTPNAPIFPPNPSNMGPSFPSGPYMPPSYFSTPYKPVFPFLFALDMASSRLFICSSVALIPALSKEVETKRRNWLLLAIVFPSILYLSQELTICDVIPRHTLFQGDMRIH